MPLITVIPDPFSFRLFHSSIQIFLKSLYMQEHTNMYDDTSYKIFRFINYAACEVSVNMEIIQSNKHMICFLVNYNLFCYIKIFFTISKVLGYL
jgi:hypothetical protein